MGKKQCISFGCSLLDIMSFGVVLMFANYNDLKVSRSLVSEFCMRSHVLAMEVDLCLQSGELSKYNGLCEDSSKGKSFFLLALNSYFTLNGVPPGMTSKPNIYVLFVIAVSGLGPLLSVMSWIFCGICQCKKMYLSLVG